MDKLLVIGTLLSYAGLALVYVSHLKHKSSIADYRKYLNTDLEESFSQITDAVNEVATFAYTLSEKVTPPAKKAPAKKAAATKAPAKKAAPRKN